MAIGQARVHASNEMKGGGRMKGLRIIVPAFITILLIALAVVSAIWLTGLVPAGEWAEFIEAGIVILIIGTVLLVIAWSAYFSYIIRKSLKPD